MPVEREAVARSVVVVAVLVVLGLVLCASTCEAAEVDDRPVVEVALSKGCGPCVKFQQWHQSPAGQKSKYRFDIKTYDSNDMPKWADGGTPAFRIPDPVHEHLKWSGWHGEAYIDKHYKLSKPAVGATIDEKLTQTLGKSGTLQFSPGEPVEIKLDDGSTIYYSRITGTYETNNGVLETKFTDQRPKFRVRRYGFGLNGEITGFDYPAKDGAVGVSTNYGRYLFKMEKAK